MSGLDIDRAVRERYGAGAQQREQALCCAVDYDPTLLEVIPKEILERDYGCGDPSQHVRVGDRVLDLGSGTGKICYIAAQKVGASGRVIGIDVNEEMLALSEKHRRSIGDVLGYHNVEFRKGAIQDLGLDLARVEAWLTEHPVRGIVDLQALEAFQEQLRRESPLVPDESIDLVLSNCVLNLVKPSAKRMLFSEIHRVLAPGGRIAISDIVSDRDIPEALQNDAELWSGCVSGAFREDRFLHAFEQAGFRGLRIAVRGREPWQIVEGIEFRSVTVTGVKPPEKIGGEKSVLYRGPWRAVQDESGRTLERGIPTRVSAADYALLTGSEYDAGVEGLEGVDGASCCPPTTQESKSQSSPSSDSPSSCC